MAFGEKDEKTDDGRAGLASTESPTWPSMESIESLSPIKESTPVTSLIHDSGLSESSPSLFHDDVRDDEDDDDEGSESATEEQHFEEHEAVCKRLERTLGLGLWNNMTGNGDRDFDDWTELACVIGSQYGTKLDFNVVKTATRHNVSPSALLLCLIYLERLHSTNGRVSTDNSMNSSELFIVSLMSACKFLYDVGEVGDCYNGTWARQCKIPLKKLNRLEVNFLTALDWDLHSSDVEFEKMMTKVQTGIVNSHMKYRPSMTYSDMTALLHFNPGFTSLFVKSLISRIARIVAVLAASYVSFGVLSVLMYTTLLSSPSTRSTNHSSHVSKEASTISENQRTSDTVVRKETNSGQPVEETDLSNDAIVLSEPVLGHRSVLVIPSVAHKVRQKRARRVMCPHTLHKDDESVLLRSFPPGRVSSISNLDLNDSWRYGFEGQGWRNSIFWPTKTLLCS